MKHRMMQKYQGSVIYPEKLAIMEIVGLSYVFIQPRNFAGSTSPHKVGSTPSVNEYSSLLILQAHSGSGSYIVDVTLHTYRNPSGRCQQCQSGPDVGCCDETFVRPLFQSCNASACDPIILYCNTEYIGGDCGSLSASTFYTRDASFLDLSGSSSIFDGDNTVTIQSDNPWRVSCMCYCIAFL